MRISIIYLLIMYQKNTTVLYLLLMKTIVNVNKIHKVSCGAGINCLQIPQVECKLLLGYDVISRKDFP